MTTLTLARNKKRSVTSIRDKNITNTINNASVFSRNDYDDDNDRNNKHKNVNFALDANVNSTAAEIKT